MISVAAHIAVTRCCVVARFRKSWEGRVLRILNQVSSEVSVFRSHPMTNSEWDIDSSSRSSTVLGQLLFGKIIIFTLYRNVCALVITLFSEVMDRNIQTEV